MRAVPSLAWRLLRGSGRRGALTTGLSVLAVAIATSLLLLTLGVALGFTERADRQSWLQPRGVSADATALMAVSTDIVRGTPIAVVELAALSDEPPLPPGMEKFPAPGEVWVSPALADRIAALPASELGQRFENEAADRHIAGRIGDAALTYPDQLLAVIGRDADTLQRAPGSLLWAGPYSAAPTAIADFSGEEPYYAPVYRALSAFASALLIVPLFVLGTAAGRLSTAQRDRRLAAMRLVGATPAQVVAITTFETILIGVIGAVLGAAAYIVTLPLSAKVSATGGTWFVSDLWVGPRILAATLVGVPLIVGMSALLGMRALTVSPLGVARRQVPRKATFWRLVIFVAVFIAYAILAPRTTIDGAVFFAAFLGIVFLTLSILGPFVVRMLGHAMAMLARGPESLLAARRIIDDPFTGWRIVGGVVLTGFVAGFLTVIIPDDFGAFRDGAYDYLEVAVAPRDASATYTRLSDTLREAGIEATGTGDDTTWVVGVDSQDAFTTLTFWIENSDDLDRARTLIVGTAPFTHPVSPESSRWEEHVHSTDIRMASVLVLAVTLAVAAASAAITGVTGVLDRRQTLSSLRIAGTPLRVLDGARVRETLVPFIVLGGGAIGAGIFCATPLAVLAGTNTQGIAYGSLLIPATVAVLGMALAEIASRMTLRSVTADPTAYRQS